MLSIGALSRETGVKVPTIRYYEEMGLIARPARTEGNQRRYGVGDVRRLAFIRHARDLGLPIDAIRALIRLDGHPDGPCDDAHRIAEDHLAAVRARIARLRRLEKELQRIASACTEGGDAGTCDLLHALGDHDLCARDH